MRFSLLPREQMLTDLLLETRGESETYIEEKDFHLSWFCWLNSWDKYESVCVSILHCTVAVQVLWRPNYIFISCQQL